MRNLVLFFLFCSGVFSHELIYISNNIENVDGVFKKYKQDLVIHDNHIYLIPKECRLERYFGGVSQGNLELIQKPVHTNEITITQEVFEAKEIQVIQNKIDLEKSISLVQGKEAKEFLADDEGRAFGGASEIPLDFKRQKMKAVSVNMIPATKHKLIKEDATPFQHPSCKLLEDGSGYILLDIKEARFYNDKGFYKISNHEVFFN